jgi:hypothetical protein
MSRFLLLSTIGLAACTQSSIDSGTAALRSLETGRATRVLNIVAHQDDDFLFINPDLVREIQSGATVRTIFVTAGNQEPGYWQTREIGIRAGYAQMANLPNSWTESTTSAAGQNAYTISLDHSTVSVIFLRLSSYTWPMLDELWNRRDDPTVILGSEDNNLHVSGATLIQLLQDLMDQFQPDHVQTLNSSRLYGLAADGSFEDNPEHSGTSQFAVEAYRRRAGAHSLLQYRGYDMYDVNSDGNGNYWLVSTTPVNLSADDIALKTHAADGYFTLDPHFGPCNNGANWWCDVNDWRESYAGWLQRKYPVADLAPDFVSTDFGDADLTNHSSYGQTFRLADVNGDGKPDACVRRWDGIRCALSHCEQFAPHVAFTAEFSQYHGWDDDSYGSTIRFADLNHDGKADVCGRGAAGILCALANANGTAFLSATVWTSDFSNGQGWADLPAYYGSIRFADVDGDGYPDVCGRGNAGIWCALNDQKGHFGPKSLWLASNFGNDQGWGAPQYGTTMQLGDVNGDGRADICGRGANGVLCALSTGTGFLPASLWSTEFSDAAGWSQVAYYGSLRLADVDGDGRADLCGRGVAGLVCARSNGATSFGDAQVYSAEFSNAQGWAPAQYGSTIQLAEIDRHVIQVCARGPNNLKCTRLGQ